jgi:hypothetical protein
MAIRIRYPSWAERGMVIKINEAAFPHQAKPGSFVTLSRPWKNGDHIEVKLPMNLRLEPMPDNPTRAAICYGPVVLAGELGREEIKPPMPYAIKQSDFFKVKQPPMPVFLTEGRPVTDWVQPVPGKPLTFQTKGVSQPKDITLVAFHTLSPQRYSIYWDLSTTAQWKNRLSADAAQVLRVKELEAKTVDSTGIGDAKMEKAHDQKGENTSTGTFSNRPYRAAAKGGWFSYVLKVPSGQAAQLLCTYWGSDAGPRNFDILVNDTRISTQKLDHNQPGEFFDVVHDLPAEMITGKTQVIVKFQAHPGQIAGGLYDLCILQAEGK